MPKVTDLTAYRKIHTARQVHHQALIDSMGEPRENFFRVSHRTVTCNRFTSLPSRAKVLFLTLCSARNRYQRQKAYFTRSVRQLATDTNLSSHTIQKAIKDLKEAGFLISNHRPSGRTRFQIVDLKQLKIVS